MSRGFDRSDLIKEKATMEPCQSTSRDLPAANRGELVKGSEEWQRARDEARAHIKEKTRKMREETLAHQKELEKYGNGDYESAHDGGPEPCNPNFTY